MIGPTLMPPISSTRRSALSSARLRKPAQRSLKPSPRLTDEREIPEAETEGSRVQEEEVIDGSGDVAEVGAHGKSLDGPSGNEGGVQARGRGPDRRDEHQELAERWRVIMTSC